MDEIFINLNLHHLKILLPVAEKGPSIPPPAGLPLSLVIATYFYVRLIPRDFFA